jgi:L-arabinonolactonase
MVARAEIVVDAGNLLGEGIVWSPIHNEVQWVDIHGKTFWSFASSTYAARSIDLPERLACFAPLDGSRILAGFASGPACFDLATGALGTIAEIEVDRPSTRLDDGKLGRQGRLVFGTMDEGESSQPIGQVWSYAGGLPRVLFGGVRISNSIAFSPDGGACISRTRRRARSGAATMTSKPARFQIAGSSPRLDRGKAGPTAACGTPDGAARASYATRPRGESTELSRFLVRK